MTKLDHVHEERIAAHRATVEQVRSCNLVLLGEAPGNYPRYDPAFHALFPYPPGSAGARLRKLMGMGMAEYVALSRRNLFGKYPGKCGKGAKFDVPTARELVRQIHAEGTLYGTNLLIVGRRTAKAFGYERHPLLTWHRALAYSFAIVPHPSGVNRWWNDEVNEGLGKAFLRRVADQARRGAQTFE